MRDTAPCLLTRLDTVTWASRTSQPAPEHVRTHRPSVVPGLALQHRDLSNLQTRSPRLQIRDVKELREQALLLLPIQGTIRHTPFPNTRAVYAVFAVFAEIRTCTSPPLLHIPTLACPL